MKQIFIALLSIISSTSFAQTKAIAFKSHSGDMNNFRIALSNDLFGSEESNFGNPYVDPSKFRVINNLVGVVYLSKSKAALTIKVYPSEYFEPKDSARLATLVTDTVYNDPLFSKKHSLDSIREVLKTSWEYGNHVNEIIFIGYDNNNKLKSNKKTTIKDNSKPKENSIPIIVTNDNNSGENSPFDAAMAKALAGILLLALLGGWLSWKYGDYLTKKHNRIPDQLAVA